MFFDLDATPAQLNPISPLVDPGDAVPGAGQGLLMELRGTDYLVPALEDEESARFTDEEGMSILADTDGDGRIDYVSNVTFDGQWSAWRWQEDAGEGDNPPAGLPPKSPDIGDDTWRQDRWICVERGEWG